MEEFQYLSKLFNFDNWTYCYKGNTAPKTFIGFKCTIRFYKNINEGPITQEKAEEEKKNLNRK